MSKAPDRFGGKAEMARGLTGAFEFTGSVLLFWLFGFWTDNWLGTDPWFQVVGAVIGWVGGFWHVYYRYYAPPKPKASPKAPDGSVERQEGKAS